MAKRQKRFTGANLSAAELIGKEVNIIKNDGTVFHIKLLGSTQEHLSGEDLRKKKYKFALKEVNEIILDLVSSD
jgi:hypothetical protein